ncbi:hypothetical protein TNCV_782351 [Trichonephila clavipes]|nr:hypothetical protein TNCV_782351 [Trichonephila clavipes]
MVKKAMPLNRFEKLKSYLHFVDNGTVNQHVQDRAFEVKPLSANNKLMKFGGEMSGQKKLNLQEDLYLKQNLPSSRDALTDDSSDEELPANNPLEILSDPEEDNQEIAQDQGYRSSCSENTLL